MSEVTLLCFLQGIDEPFNVAVDNTNTIALLKKIILLRKRGNIHDDVKVWKVSVPTDNIASLRKDPPKVMDFIELDDEKLVSDAIEFARMGIVQVYVGEVLEKTPSLKDEMRELKVFVHDQAQKQSQMREDIQRLTDRFERLSTDEENENPQDIRIPTLNTIVLFRDEIKNMYEVNKNILVQKELVDEANEGEGSISQDTFADFIYGRSNISTKQNKNAMIYIYYTLKRFEALKARNS